MIGPPVEPPHSQNRHGPGERSPEHRMNDDDDDDATPPQPHTVALPKLLTIPLLTVVSLSVFGIMALVFANVFSRYLLNQPIAGAGRPRNGDRGRLRRICRRAGNRPASARPDGLTNPAPLPVRPTAGPKQIKKRVPKTVDSGLRNREASRLGGRCAFDDYPPPAIGHKIYRPAGRCSVAPHVHNTDYGANSACTVESMEQLHHANFAWLARPAGGATLRIRSGFR